MGTNDGPDGWKAVRVSKGRYHPSQDAMDITGTVNILGGADVEIDVYTIPAGYVASFSSLWITCGCDTWMDGEIRAYGVTTGYFTFKRMFLFVDADLGTFTDPAGTNLKLYLKNNDLAAQDFKWATWGTQEKI